MKTFLLLASLLITAPAFVRGTPSLEGTKTISSEKRDENKSRPNSVVVINIDHLREKTKDVSLLMPVFMIVSVVEIVTEKLHGRKLKITCNKSADKRD